MRHTAETTLHGIILLLKLCPCLRSFHVVIDATKLDGLRSDKLGGVYNMDSPINDTEVVACIFLDILPDLESVLV